MRSTPGACRASLSYPPVIRCDVSRSFHNSSVQSGSIRRLVRAYHFCASRNTNRVLSKRSRPLSGPFKSSSANHRCDLGREQLDHAGDFGKRQAADVDLRQETLVAEQLALIQDLVDNLLRAADENRAMGCGAFVIIGPRDLLGAILRGGVGEKVAGIVRIKRVQSLL